MSDEWLLFCTKKVMSDKDQTTVIGLFCYMWKTKQKNNVSSVII